MNHTSTNTDCVFCKIVNSQAPAEIVYEDENTVAFLDSHPQTRGHLQLIPKKHYQWIYEIPDLGTFFITAGRIIRGIIPVLKADHVTIASFGHQVKHAHLWIVPQYGRSMGLEEGRQGGEIGDKKLAERLRAALREEVSHVL